MVMTRPRDVRRAGDPVDLRWVKRRWKCAAEACGRKTFTEWLPAVPPRCRITGRLREQAGSEVTDRGITPAEAARHAGISAARPQTAPPDITLHNVHYRRFGFT
jgi:hypothetical protein